MSGHARSKKSQYPRGKHPNSILAHKRNSILGRINYYKAGLETLQLELSNLLSEDQVEGNEAILFSEWTQVRMATDYLYHAATLLSARINKIKQAKEESSDDN